MRKESKSFEVVQLRGHREMYLTRLAYSSENTKPFGDLSPCKIVELTCHALNIFRERRDNVHELFNFFFYLEHPTEVRCGERVFSEDHLRFGGRALWSDRRRRRKSKRRR